MVPRATLTPLAEPMTPYLPIPSPASTPSPAHVFSPVWSEGSTGYHVATKL